MTQTPQQQVPIFVFGPKGCGKTRNRETLQKMLGCDRSMDWEPGDRIRPGVLYFTNADPRAHTNERIAAFAYADLVYGEEFL